MISNRFSKFKRQSVIKQQQRFIWPLIVGGTVVFAVSTVAHYALRAINRSREPRNTSESQDNTAQTMNQDIPCEEPSHFHAPLVRINQAYGIDIGSSFAKLSHITDGIVSTLEDREGRRSTATCLNFFDSETSIGHSARNRRFLASVDSAFGTQPIVGLNSTHPLFALAMKSLPCIQQHDGQCHIMTRDSSRYQLPDISTMITKVLLDTARSKNDFLYNSSPAIASVPNYFDGLQMKLTVQSCRMAGFSCDMAVHDAVCAYLGMLQANLCLPLEKNKDILVVDVGGRLTQLCLLSSGTGLGSDCPPSVADNIALFNSGGDAMDDALVQYLAEQFTTQEVSHRQLDLMSDSMSKQRLYDAVEAAKTILSTSGSTHINIPFITADSKGPKHLSCSLTRAQLEVVIAPVISTLTQGIKQLLADSKQPIQSVLLVGGCARVPAVREAVEQLFATTGNTTDILLCHEPEEIVSRGAAVYLTKFPSSS